MGLGVGTGGRWTDERTDMMRTVFCVATNKTPPPALPAYVHIQLVFSFSGRYTYLDLISLSDPFCSNISVWSPSWLSALLVLCIFTLIIGARQGRKHISGPRCTRKNAVWLEYHFSLKVIFMVVVEDVKSR